MGQRVSYFYRWIALAAIIVSLRVARADQYDPPSSYYSSITTQTGATLKTDLRTIVSDMEPVTYGEARDSAAITDADPNVPGNILLIYNRASIDGAWVPGPPLAWNREHIWPESRVGSNANNNTANSASDQFNLRPANEQINNTRGNRPFGLDTTTGNHGTVGATYYYPGDADAGDVARSQFYMATRWSNLSLTDGTPGALQNGDLSSLIVYHFKDVPDTFERRRNHAIYGLPGETGVAIENPYRQENRNPYVDHPEWVWSVFVDQLNDSQISINGASVGADGGSTQNVDLGRIFVGGSVPAAQNFTLNKNGDDGTYYEVTTDGDATSTVTGRLNAFRTSMTDSRSITVGLDTKTHVAGLKQGTVTVNNLDITTGFGNGRGAQDANDVFNVSLAVLDHATPSFAGGIEDAALTIDFGTWHVGESAPIENFDIFNFATTAIYTADLDFDSFTVEGDVGAFTTDLGDYDGLLSLAADASHSFMTSLSTAAQGIFEATYTLNFSDEDLVGALTKSITLTLLGQVLASTPALPGDYNLDGVVDAADYTVWRNTLGETVAAYDGADGNGNTTIDAGDYGVWKMHYGDMATGAGSGGLTPVGVPEPSALVLLSLALSAAAGRRRR